MLRRNDTTARFGYFFFCGCRAGDVRHGKLSPERAAAKNFDRLAFGFDQLVLGKRLERYRISVIENIQVADIQDTWAAVMQTVESVFLMRTLVARFVGCAGLLGEQLPDAIVAAAKTRLDRSSGSSFLTLGSAARGCAALATPANALGTFATCLWLYLMELHRKKLYPELAKGLKRRHGDVELVVGAAQEFARETLDAGKLGNDTHRTASFDSPLGGFQNHPRAGKL